MSEVQIAIIDQEDTQITLAVPGVQGPVGNAIPSGGTTNQVLFKSSATNYDATWGNVTSAMITDLAIVDADVSASAAIVDTKLATIATAGKVSNSATTAASANTASAIVARDASGNFTAGTITAALTGAASSNVLKAGDTMTGALVVPLASASTPSLTFTGDLNTGIYSPGADQLAVATNGTQKLIVLSNGNVGIGSSAPSALLELGGSVALSATRAIYARYPSDSKNPGRTAFEITVNEGGTEKAAFQVMGDGSIQGNTYEGTIFRNSGNNEIARFDTSNRLGIGTSSPSGLLHVQSNLAGNNQIILTNIASSNSGAGSEIVFTQGASGHAAGKIQCDREGAYSATVSTHDSALAFFTAADGVDTERLRITSAGLVGIGTTSPATTLDVNGDVTITDKIIHGGDTNTAIRFPAADTVSVETAGSERARIDSSGRLLVGTSSASTATSASTARIQIVGHTGGTETPGRLVLRRNETSSNISVNEQIGQIYFGDNEAGEYALIECASEGTAGAGDYPGRLVFSTTANGASSPTERMRITSEGYIRFIDTSANASTSGYGATFVQLGTVGSTARTSLQQRSETTSSTTIQLYYNPNGQVGSISTSASATVYATSSDYRLKENIAAVTDGITRLQQLKPSRFNFKVDPSHTVDGFIAHEAQAVVPECVTGTKDEVDEDGNPVYQGIDQSKLVPLLTAALQEAIAKIETLEQRLTAAGID